jgi:hypothetical protein
MTPEIAGISLGVVLALGLLAAKRMIQDRVFFDVYDVRGHEPSGLPRGRAMLSAASSQGLKLLQRWLGRFSSRGRTPSERPYPFIFVEADGTARELHAGEREYLETEFEGADGARPYIKGKYQQRDGWGALSGYMKRSKLPAGTSVSQAPLDDPSKPLSRDEYVAFLRAKGQEVTENADGTFVAGRITHHWLEGEERSSDVLK